MNAIKLYVSTARLILENDHYDYSICKEINNTFPNLEQSLTCTVCRNILTEPYSPIESTCQHHVCKSCIGGRKKLRPSCSWCKDYSKYVKNTQLQCLLACYKGLCQYIKCTNLLTQLSDSFPLLESDKNVLNIVEKGTELPYHNKEIKVKMEFSKTYENPKPTFITNENEDSKYRLFDMHISSPTIQDNHIFDNSISSTSKSNDSCILNIPRIKTEQNLPELSSTSLDKFLSQREKQFDLTNTRASSPKMKNVPADDVGRLYNANTNDLSHDFTSTNLNSKSLYSVTFAGTKSKLILKRRPVIPKHDINTDQTYVMKQSNNAEQLPITAYSLRTSDYNSQVNIFLIYKI